MECSSSTLLEDHGDGATNDMTTIAGHTTLDKQGALGTQTGTSNFDLLLLFLQNPGLRSAP